MALMTKFIIKNLACRKSVLEYFWKLTVEQPLLKSFFSVRKKKQIFPVYLQNSFRQLFHSTPVNDCFCFNDVKVNLTFRKTVSNHVYYTVCLAPSRVHAFLDSLSNYLLLHLILSFARSQNILYEKQRE